MAKRNDNRADGKTINSHASMDKAVKSVCDYCAVIKPRAFVLIGIPMDRAKISNLSN